jgi:hypothetical protein
MKFCVRQLRQAENRYSQLFIETFSSNTPFEFSPKELMVVVANFF